MSKSKYKAYQDNAVYTASGGDLTLMLYNGCIKFIKQAIKDMKENNYEAKNTNIQKAQSIVRELMITLDPNVEISNQIMPLYDYMLYQLRQGNIKNDTASLDAALRFVTEFRDTWKQVILKSRKQQFAKGASV